MHDDRLATAIRNAGEAFEPPWLDVGSITRRGRRRWWVTLAVAVTASLALVAAGAAVATRITVSDRRAQPAATGRLAEWKVLPDAPIGGRIRPSAVWTGRELLVSGGQPFEGRRALVDGAAYDPTTGSWRKLPPVPEAVGGQSAVWTGRELLVWGGEREDLAADYNGFSFDPAAERWTPLPPAPRGSLGGHTAVWTGREMLVWGGVTGPSSGLRYDPAARRWSRFPEGPLGNRQAHDAVWTGKEMLVWGGGTQDGTPPEGPEGAAFDPATGAWRTLPDSPLERVYAPVSVWTGREMLVIGGLGEEVPPRRGAAYDPARDEWRAIADAPPAEARDGAPTPLTDLHTTAVWTGREAVFVTADGILTYRPGEDRWTRAPAPEDAWRLGATTVWSGSALITWSGRTWDAASYSSGGWLARY